MTGDLPIGGSTGLCHESSAAIDEAARWLAQTPRDGRGGPAVPALRERFGLSPSDAVEAIRQANIIRARAA